MSLVLNLDGREEYGDAACSLIAEVIKQNFAQHPPSHISALGARCTENQAPTLQALSLNLSGTGLGDAGCAVLAQVIGESQALTSIELHLEGTKVSEEGFLLLVQAVSHCRALTSITFNLHHAINDMGCVLLAQAVCQCQALTSLKLGLGFTNVSDLGCAVLAEAIGQSRALSSVKLDLLGAQIGDESCVALAEAICQSPALSSIELEFWHTQVGDRGCLALAQALSQTRTLSSMKLNFPGGPSGQEGYAALARAVQRNVTLQQIGVEVDYEELGICRVVEARNREIQRQRIALARLSHCGSDAGFGSLRQRRFKHHIFCYYLPAACGLIPVELAEGRNGRRNCKPELGGELGTAAGSAYPHRRGVAAEPACRQDLASAHIEGGEADDNDSEGFEET